MSGIAVLISALTRQGPCLGALAFQQLYYLKGFPCLLISRYTTFHSGKLIGNVVLSRTYLKMWSILNFKHRIDNVVSFDLKSDLINILSRGRSIIYLRANNKENYSDTFGSLIGFFLYQIHKIILLRADMILVLSETMRYDYLNDKRIYKKIHVLPNFIDQKNYSNIVKKPNSYLVVASLIARKRVIETVDSFLSEFQCVKDISLTIIGDGILKSKLKKMLNERIYDFKITFVNESVDPSDYFASHEYFILMSKSEGLSRASLEAANSGCKLILSNIDIHKEYYNDIALLINDFEELRVALRKCYLGENFFYPAFPFICSESYVWSKIKSYNLL
jgi:glycosyltransferase involved in cell wall biosynthesis